MFANVSTATKTSAASLDKLLGSDLLMVQSLMRRLRSSERIRQKRAEGRPEDRAEDTWSMLRCPDRIRRQRRREQFATALWCKRKVFAEVIISNYRDILEEKMQRKFGEVDEITEKQAFLSATRLDSRAEKISVLRLAQREMQHA